MPYPSSHFLIAFGGSLGGSESWQCTLREMYGNWNLSQQDEQDECQAVADAIAAWFTTNATYWSASVSLEFVKRNLIGSDGKYVRQYTNLVEYEPPLLGTGARSLPNQCAVAMTLETGAARGLANRGRIYLPVLKATVDTDGRISSGVANSISLLGVGLVDAINGVPGIGARVAVVSNTREGMAREVTHVAVGRVIDTLRSRRTSLDEERVPVPVSPPA